MRKISIIKSLFVILFLFTFQGLRGQNGTSYKLEDSLKYSLLKNPFIQIESSEAIDAMYNFEFQKSISHFNYLQKQYPWHPLPHLLKSLNYWWRIVPDLDDTTWDEAFFAHIDSTKILAYAIQDFNEIEASFFLAAAYAFEGRLYSDRRQYRKAAFASKNSLKYLGECRGHETYSPELLFGDALFNYYAEWIRDEYPLLRPIMMLFPSGDKEKGINQLKETARNAFYSRTEAQYYLMRILSSERKDRAESMQVGKYLHEQYPDNSFFHRYYARLLYQSGKYGKAKELSLTILQKIDSGKTGYGANSGRYAGFFLGHIYEMQRDVEQSKKYYLLGMEYAEEIGAQEMGYYLYSL
ncbi:MAG: tol-pal system protein YbgF, partial [Bacteroidota bacterium]